MCYTLNELYYKNNLFKQEMKDCLKRQVIAFDLDYTLIDSSHRQRIDENGKFDLDYWKEKSTWEYISKDTLLPLFFSFLGFKQVGYTIIAVTAREMSEADYRYLAENGLDFDFVLERGNSNELDDILKNGKLKEFLSVEGRIPFLFYDDKDDNLAVAAKYGFTPMKAQVYNLKHVVKDYHSIRNIHSIENFSPKEEDLATSNIQILSKKD